jgi:hypothetical protein
MARFVELEQDTAGNAGGSVCTQLLAAPRLQESEYVKSMLPKWRTGSLKRAIMFELTCVVEVAEPFVKATFFLEGDGPMAMLAYDVIMELEEMRKEMLPSMRFPEVRKLASQYAAAGREPPSCESQVTAGGGSYSVRART